MSVEANPLMYIAGFIVVCGWIATVFVLRRSIIAHDKMLIMVSLTSIILCVSSSVALFTGRYASVMIVGVGSIATAARAYCVTATKK